MHYYEDINDAFDHIEIYDYVIGGVSSPSVFIEVGSWTGKSTAYLGVEVLNLIKPIKIFSSEDFNEDFIDPTLSEELIENRKVQLTFERRNNDISINSVCNTTITSPFDLCKLFHFGEIDFCFINSNHYSEEIENNIRLWWPKIKSGGILAGSGHDNPIVSQSASQILGNYKLQTYNGSVNWICKKGGPQNFSGLNGISNS